MVLGIIALDPLLQGIINTKTKWIALASDKALVVLGYTRIDATPQEPLWGTSAKTSILVPEDMGSCSQSWAHAMQGLMKPFVLAVLGLQGSCCKNLHTFLRLYLSDTHHVLPSLMLRLLYLSSFPSFTFAKRRPA